MMADACTATELENERLKAENERLRRALKETEAAQEDSRKKAIQHLEEAKALRERLASIARLAESP